MLASSLAVIAAGLIALGAALAAFLWAWWRGQFGALDRQSLVIFDERDLRVDRPWESTTQRLARRAHGRPCAPAPGEWGDGA